MTPENRIRDSFARQTMMQTLGARIESIAPGKVALTAPILPGSRQQQGFAHAALTFALGDTAAGYAALSVMPEDAAVLTIEFKINLLSPGRGDRFLFRGEVTKPGNTIIVSDGRAYAIADGPAKLIASMTGTMMVVRGREGIAG